jgi:hypothetical protein
MEHGDAQRIRSRIGPGLERALAVGDSWLFAKGASSVRIMRTSALSLAVCGPGRVRRFLSFLSETELVAFLRDTEYALASTGFRFRGYATERRRQGDRRTLSRGAERRGPAPW